MRTHLGAGAGTLVLWRCDQVRGGQEVRGLGAVEWEAEAEEKLSAGPRVRQVTRNWRMESAWLPEGNES